MKRAILVFVAISVAASLLVLAGTTKSAVAAFPGTNGKIVFWSNRPSGPGLYTTTLGGAATKISGTSIGDSQAAWSPDGSRIAFQSGSTTSKEISVMNADGGGRRQLTNTPDIAEQEPAWSPDGTRIVFAADSSGADTTTDLEIWMMNADGSGLTQLTNTAQGVRDTHPAWSPLGGRIAFLSEGRTGDTNSNIYVMDTNPATDDATNLTPNDFTTNPVYQWNDESPSWSPDGTRITYTTVHDVWRMNADGTGKTNLTLGNGGGLNPAWSPDGNSIVYVRRDPDFNIYSINASGGIPSPVEITNGKDDGPDRQPVPQCTNVNPTQNADVITGTPGEDVLCGMGGNDKINGGGGNDLILGGSGNDTLVGAVGRDTLNGGPGVDTASFAGSATRVRASLTSEFARRLGTNPLEGVALLSIENLTGSAFSDDLTGSNGSNRLTGGKGADELLGLGGKDRLDSKDGVKRNDSLNGGKGADRCVTDLREASIKSC